MAEQIGALSYAALGKQTDPNTPVTPTVYAPFYKHGIKADRNRQALTPIYGGKFETYQTVDGVAQVTGPLTAFADANSVGYWLDMFATQGSTTGPVNGIYTRGYVESRTTNPNSYTLDVAYGLSQVIRYWGIQAGQVGFSFEGEELRLDLNLSGLGWNDGREIATVTTNTITLKTDAFANPTLGFVASDLVAVKKQDGSIAPLNTTITTVTPGTNTLVLGASAAAFAPGDMIVLRPGTPSINSSNPLPFTFARTFWYLGANATAALAGTPVRLEPETSLSLMHKFMKDEGERRFGGGFPAALVRTVYNAEYKQKLYLDNPDIVQQYNAMPKRAVVMQCLAGSSNEYLLQATLNDIRPKTIDRPIDGEGILYHEVDYIPNYGQSEGAGLALLTKNGIATI